ncbi:flavoprotein [Kribbella deserti]|uniref:Flavoprotein n=1 Tax=Kribbella deserti TaxID=1926257 RepID=A0ABV6QQY4_9ACTN
MPADRLAVVCTGASAALDLPSHLAHWRQEVGGPMSVMLTHSALTFVQPSAVGLIADEVFEPGGPVVNPVAFANQARLFVVAPCTANFLVSAALGLASSPALTAMLATPAPRILFPHMNPRMWQAPTTQQAVRSLREQDVIVVSPEDTTVLTLWSGEFEPSKAMPAPARTASVIALHWRNLVAA